MNWESILNSIEKFEINFNKSYKCINKHQPPTQVTLSKHIDILKENYCCICLTLNDCYQKLTPEHKLEADEIFHKLRDRLVRVFGRYKLHINVPTSLSEQVLVGLIDNNSSSESEEEEIENMSLSVLDFLNFATKVIPDFDGKHENLQRFLDSIHLVKTQSAGHEATFVQLIKTKLVGTSRNVISGEETVNEILHSLKTKIKNESTDVIIAKIMNVKQNNKSANQFAKEIEDLTKSLKTAYIVDGLNSELAEQYATKTAAKAFSSNSSNEKVKLVIQSGQFTDMNQVVSKFVSTSTEFCQDKHLFHYNSNRRGNKNFHNRNRNQYSGNRNYYQYGNNQNRSNYQRGSGNGNRGSYNNSHNRSNRSNSNHNYQSNNVRVYSEVQPENCQAPQDYSLGSARQQQS